MQIASEWNDEGLYKDIFVEAPFACFSIGMDGRIRAANKQALALVGYRSSEVLGRPVFDLCADTPAGKPKAEEQFLQFRSGSEVRATELQMRRADGTSVWIDLWVKPIRDRTGRVTASCSVVEEITGQLSPVDLSQFQQDRDRLTPTPCSSREAHRFSLLLKTRTDPFPNADAEFLMDHEVCGFASNQVLSHCVDSRGWMHTLCPKKRFCDEPQQNGDKTKQ